MACAPDLDFSTENRPIRYRPTESVALPAGFTVRSVAIGSNHACALSTAGKVACWGDNAQGQLGQDAEKVSRSKAAVVVGGVSGVDQLVAGAWFTCARTSAGQVLCWGDANANHNIDGSYLWEAYCNERLARDEHASCEDLEQAEASAPSGSISTVPLRERATELVGGDTFACARLASRDVVCWGQGFGQNSKD